MWVSLPVIVYTFSYFLDGKQNLQLKNIKQLMQDAMPKHANKKFNFKDLFIQFSEKNNLKIN